LKVPCKINPNLFQAGNLKKVVCHTYKSEKNQGTLQITSQGAD
jgi:hypothetical protein